jgi:hypothetical protein
MKHKSKPRQLTLGDLVYMVAMSSKNGNEVLAVVSDLLQSRQVRFGNGMLARIE